MNYDNINTEVKGLYDEIRDRLNRALRNYVIEHGEGQHATDHYIVDVAGFGLYLSEDCEIDYLEAASELDLVYYGVFNESDGTLWKNAPLTDTSVMYQAFKMLCL